MNDFIPSLSCNRARSKRGAFSLLEVAFALVIFVIGAIALLRIFPTGLDVLEDSGNRRVASQMSQNVLTSYNSGDLASTTPEAIYDSDGSGNWDDYPLSVAGLRRQSGTLPTDPDDFTSAKDALKHIQGERQGVFATNVYLNNIASGRVLFYKEGAVSDVTVDPSGQLEFRKAHYLVSNRADLDSNPTKVDFRQPYLDEAEGIPVNNGVITLQRGAAPMDYLITWPFRTSNGMGSASDVTGVAAASGTSDCTSSPVAPGGTGLTCTITVPGNNTQNDEYLTITFTPNANASVRRAVFVCKIIGPNGAATGSTPPTASAVLPIRAPSNLQGGCTYYVSSSWNSGANSAYDQPMVLPNNYAQGSATVAVVPSKIAYNSTDPQLLTPLRFRQYLGFNNAQRSGAPVPLPTGPNDADGNPSTQNITRVSLDYDVQDWEYISEDVSQFGTPFPGDGQQINTTTPEGLSQVQFQYTTPVQSPAPTAMPRANLREIRTRIGNLRGPVQIKGLYDQSAQYLDVTFNPRAAAQGAVALTPAQQRSYSQQANTLAKQGRLYLPAQIFDGTNTVDLSRARVYYRSRDAWAQQVGVTAPHYVPYLANTGIAHEPWREYVRGTDNYLYFHASEAGKKVECVYGTNLAATSIDTIDISPEVLFVSALPAGVPATFANTAFNNPKNTNDPRNTKFYLARSRDPIRSAFNIFDVRRPTGSSGIAVRTLWLNNNRYAQEIAQ
ncbi:hypothetical protein IAD21_05223 [Abditibacteriota bacterium]|nr:hypothetical protein IAD21_05223 [Abditibacteriota bacterium]